LAARKASIPKVKLSKVLRAIAPEYVLGTTYTLSLAFFESVVMPQIKREQLKRCLILCDQVGMEMSMSEAPALRYAARDYMVATAPARGTFHAKVWLLLSKQELVLLVGSGNLTQPGFIDNAELFDAVHLRENESGRGIASQVTNFLRNLAGLWSGVTDQKLLAIETLRQMAESVDALLLRLGDGEPEAARFLSSFDGQFPRQLATLRPHSAYVAAPYFGNSTSGLAALQQELGVTRMRVFPAVHSDGKLDVPIEKIRDIPGARVHSLALASRHNRFAHLKLYGFETASDAWLFTGSVNCTTTALLGPNVEAGLLRQVTPEELHSYFDGDELTEAPSAGHLHLEGDLRGWLVLWATDFGDHVSLELAPSHEAVRPLHSAELILKSGQKRTSLQLDNVFHRNRNERIAWRHFGDFRSSVDSAVVAELRAKDVKGRDVRGRCLIDGHTDLRGVPLSRCSVPKVCRITAISQLCFILRRPSRKSTRAARKRDWSQYRHTASELPARPRSRFVTRLPFGRRFRWTSPRCRSDPMPTAPATFTGSTAS
jgi:HKD family nuclease